MESLQKTTAFYNRRFAWSQTAIMTSRPLECLRVSIVIPSFNEEELEKTLASLGECYLPDAGMAEVILVLNHSQQALQEIKTLHQKQWERWQDTRLDNRLQVGALAAFDLPPRHAGVGLARKIGMDEALKRFAAAGHDGLIVCLDADCTVSPNYLSSLLEAEKQGHKGLSLYYEHPLTESDVTQKKAIIDYEIFLRYYSLALHEAGYPFPFQTVGSSMAARASVYARTGGMNRRKAGEDFYFLHKLFPQGGFTGWPYCTVYPSARQSDRVPFGTGRAMLATRAGEKDYSRLYHPQIFTELKQWISDTEKIYRNDTTGCSVSINSFLKETNTGAELEQLRKRSPEIQQFERNFFFWLDGFKVLKLVHHARERFYEDIDNDIACCLLLGTEAASREDLLLQLRALEKEHPVSYI